MFDVTVASPLDSVCVCLCCCRIERTWVFASRGDEREKLIWRKETKCDYHFKSYFQCGLGTKPQLGSLSILAVSKIYQTNRIRMCGCLKNVSYLIWQPGLVLPHTTEMII